MVSKQIKFTRSPFRLFSLAQEKEKEEKEASLAPANSARSDPLPDQDVLVFSSPLDVSTDT
jgi:hypothetical protein